MISILIIGSKGFIGAALYQYLVKDTGYEVWGADVVNDYAASHYHVIDAANSDYEAIFEQQAFDVCINCSGSASVPDSFQNPSRDFYLNVVNVFKLLEAIRKYAPACKFLNISSAAVYGNPEMLPIAETALCAPLSPYGFHKLQSEKLCEEYNRFYNIATCSARIFSAFGPGLKKQLFWDLYHKSLAGDEIEIFGTGKESRDFIFIDDVVQAVALIITIDFTGQVINVANGEEVTIERAVSCFYGHTSAAISYHFKGVNRSGDPLNWNADITRLKNIGYVRKTSFEEGVQKYCSWLRNGGL